MANWIEKCTDIICPVCESVFSDEIYYMCRNRNRSESMLFCPNCGEKMGETKKNFYEKLKKMSVDEMTEFFVEMCVGSFFSAFGSTHIPSQEFIKSMPQYNESYTSIKNMLLSDKLCSDKNEN